MNRGRILIAVAAALACIPACSGGYKKIAQAPSGQAEAMRVKALPESIDATGWVRRPEIAVFAGDSLFAYIDGAAEMYHKYGFLDLHAAEYGKGEAVITADLYRFGDSDMAFGMYTTLRPDDPDTVKLGVEGFAFDTNWIFVRGSYLVNVYTYDTVGMGEVRSVAAEIESRLPGTRDKPRAFGEFPADGRVPFSEKIYAEAFLSQDALTGVYAVDYAEGGNRVTLFSTDDPGSAKLEAWRARVEEVYDPDMGYQHLPYDGSRYLHTRDPYRGEIIAGPVGDMLVGMVGYRPEDFHILVSWLNYLTYQP